MTTRLEKYEKVAALAKALVEAQAAFLECCKECDELKDGEFAPLNKANTRWVDASQYCEHLLENLKAAIKEADLS